MDAGLANAFDLLSGSKFREDISRLSVGESILLIHACAYIALFIYGVVIVSRNLERANQNDEFKMTALEISAMSIFITRL